MRFSGNRVPWTTAVMLMTLLAAGCSTADPAAMDGSIEVKIIAFNDFHGNLEPPKMGIAAPAGTGTGTIAVPAGGAAYLATAIRQLKRRNPNHAVVSAGDMIGASPLVSALFLDEPTIEVMNAIQIDYNAVGNHEFDKGTQELLRMQHGGCAKHTKRQPCVVNPQFPGANFGFLTANTVRADGTTLFPATGIKEFASAAGKVKVGFIGLTLKNTPRLVTPAGISGLTFKDEADTANALIPVLKSQGAAAIVVILHEGGATTDGNNDKSCPNLTGDILPILDKLDPAVDVVVSGHTHRAYICDYGKTNPAKPFLLTSAGHYGTLVTDINLQIDPKLGKVVKKTAENVIIQSEAFTTASGATVGLSPLYPSFAKDEAVADVVKRYAAAAAPLSERVVGRLSASALRTAAFSGENVLGYLIADAQLAATRASRAGGAQIAFMNPGGIRADLQVPEGGGNVTFGQLFGIQPFSNTLVVKSFTGAQLHALLEQQFDSGTNLRSRPRILQPSAGFTYSYDLTRPAGARVADMRLHGTPIVDAKIYRVTMNSFLASGGDGFTVFNQGTHAMDGPLDIDAFVAYLRSASPLIVETRPRIVRLK